LLLLILFAGLSRADEPNPGVVEIADPSAYDRVVAVSDVHGMAGAQRRLLRAAGLIDGSLHWIGRKTLLIVVGDSIDKGPESLEVIDLFRALGQEADAAGGRVIHLLGNHEAEFLADPQNAKTNAKDGFRAELRAKKLPLVEVTSPDHARGRFLRAMPAAARIGDWLFCHAGFLPGEHWDDVKREAARVLREGAYSHPFLVGSDGILTAKWSERAQDLEARLRRMGLKAVVFGHRSHALGAVGSAMSGDGFFIKIDNGMSAHGGHHAGSVLQLPRGAEARPRVIDADGRDAPIAIAGE
jgi:hypothetical protein